MRPDKKKNRHHDSVKSKKAALAKEKGAQKEDTPPPKDSKPSEEDKNAGPIDAGEMPSGSGLAATTPGAQPTPNFKGVRETGEKLILEANQRYLAAQSQAEEDPKYAKRNIASNWTKFELPSEDESEDEASQNMTGEDFNYVLSTASGAESHFRLKSEKEWDPEQESGAFSTEFFSLDVVELERAVMCVPLHLHIGLKQEDLDKESLDKYQARADRHMAVYEGGVAPVEEEISQKIMDILSVGKIEKPKEVLSSEIKQNLAATVESEDVVEKVAEKVEELEFIKPEIDPPAQLEQRTRGRRSRGNKQASENPPKPEVTREVENLPEVKSDPKIEEPLDQRSGRRGRAKQVTAQVEESKDVEVPETVKEDQTKAAPAAIKEEQKKATPTVEDQEKQTKAPTTMEEKNDLEFLESFDKPKKQEEKDEKIENKEEDTEEIVPVQIVKAKETKNLEDWLDDFLDD